MAQLPQLKDLAKKKNDSRGKTLTLKIDNFENLEGPIEISAWALPVSEGDYGQLVFSGWVHSDTFSISLSGKHEFPISVGGKRMPQDIGPSPKSKETGRPVDPLEPSTWPEETFIRGSMICSKRGFCIHESRTDGKYRCPRPLIIPGGRIMHAKEPWILREDGRPVEESKLVATRAAEAIKDKEITATVNAKRAKTETLPATAFRHATPEPLNVPQVMGGSGPLGLVFHIMWNGQ